MDFNRRKIVWLPGDGVMEQGDGGFGWSSKFVKNLFLWLFGECSWPACLLDSRPVLRWWLFIICCGIVVVANIWRSVKKVTAGHEPTCLLSLLLAASIAVPGMVLLVGEISVFLAHILIRRHYHKLCFSFPHQKRRIRSGIMASSQVSWINVIPHHPRSYDYSN